MKSKLLEGIFSIKPEYIDYEKSRVDLYFAGILFETKTYLNDAKRREAFVEVRNYLKTRKNTISVVLTDGVLFETYDPEDFSEKLNQISPLRVFNIGMKTLDDIGADEEERIFNELYRTIYPRENIRLKPEVDVIVPRLLELMDRIKTEIEKDIAAKNVDYGIKYVAWKGYISKMLGSAQEANEEYFKRQAILYYITILLVARATLGIKNRKDILNGNAFFSKGILNFIEKDNFFDFVPYDHRIFLSIEEELDRYDFSESVREDIFRLLYEDLIRPSARHDLGEFYTPAWLAKFLVDEVVTKDSVILDPACGSGTFLRLVLEKKKSLGDTDYSRVVGFDINPIAVVISKANYLLTATNVRIIPVFLADSLMPNWTYQFEKENLEKFIRPDCVKINFSEVLEGYEDEWFYYDSDWTVDEMEKYIDRMREIVEDDLPIPDDMKKNELLVKKLKELQKTGNNHVWFYIIKNIYTPYYFRRKVDILLGNPPWLTYHDVKDTVRQKFLDYIYKNYEMIAGSQNKSNQDMAGFFIVRGKEYLKRQEGVKIAFVLTRSVFNGSQYNGLRLKKWNLSIIENDNTHVRLEIKKIWDVATKANPFRRSSCMILFETTDVDDVGRKPIDGVLLDSKTKVKLRISPNILSKSQIFYVNQIGKNSGISTTKLKQTKEVSPYRKLFKEGATIRPRPYFIIEVLEREKYGSKVRTPLRYTDQKDKRRSKGDYRISFNDEYVANCLIYDIVFGENIENFYVKPELKAVLPVIDNEVIFDQQIKSNSYEFNLKNLSKFNSIDQRDMNFMELLLKNYEKKFNEIERDWERHRGDKFQVNKDAKASLRMNVFNRLNRGNGLLSQKPKKHKYMVVYNKSGRSIRAAVTKTKNLIVDEMAYYSYFKNEEEAYYICGVLNSKTLLNILEMSGILSERDFHKKPFDFPIPRYNVKRKDESQKLMKKISKLTKEITSLKLSLKQRSSKSSTFKEEKKLIDEKRTELDSRVKELFLEEGLIETT